MKKAADKFKYQLSTIIADAQLQNVDRKFIREELRAADEGLKNPYEGKQRFTGPPRPQPRTFSGLAAFIRGVK